MRIDLRNDRRQRLFGVNIDPARPAAVARPPDGTDLEVHLHWHGAMGPDGALQRCPVCSCRELFARRDFPQTAGLAIVVIAAAAAAVLFAFGQVLWAIALLGGVALADALARPFVGRCLVCYRCRSEFRGMPISPDQPGWDLATGEKYRPS